MHIIIVTGLSGAGKSNVLRVLEDLSYYCVDNLPVELMPDFVKLCKRAEPTIDKAALVIDSRESVFRSDLELGFAALDAMEQKYEILFLECRDDVLERRYSETRRRHPMSSNIIEGISIERELLQSLRERANYVIDTSDLRPYELHRYIESMRLGDSQHPFMLVISSFGYKRGVPMEADIVMDMRFTKNPVYESGLRSLSGMDEPVREYVLRDPAVMDIINNLEWMLDNLIPKYIEQGKHRLMVAFGCTGGRHRSVCAAYELYTRMKDKHHCILAHRDQGREDRDISERFVNR